MLKTSPNPTDVQDLQFKLRSRLKVFDHAATNSDFSQWCSLVACASKFGLIFVGTNTTNLQVLLLKHLLQYTKNDGDKKDYPRRLIPLVSPPTHLSVNCEHTILSVVVKRDGCPYALFYDVKTFWQQEVIQLAGVFLSSTPGVSALEVNWNPTLAPIFTACKSDGTLTLYELKHPGLEINELPAGAAATCFCWSPKGKQIAVGSRDGKITQYKPDLKAVKVINAPPLNEAYSIISLQWVSNYQFIGIYQAVNSNHTNLITIDAPKSGDDIYTNYDDICYSNGNARPIQYYMILQQNWNILMVASSNSMEVGILGNSGESWLQWVMGDAARAELPLSSDHQDTLPIGCALEVGNTEPLQWGESVLPPVPILLLFSHYGILCCFNVINLKGGIVSICLTPDTIKDASGLHHFKKENGAKQQEQKQQNAPRFQQTIQTSDVLNQVKNDNPSPFVQIPTTPVDKKQGLNLTTPPLNLFGGQATLTPITQGSKTHIQQAASYQSLYPPLSGLDGQSGTKISEQISVSVPVTILKVPSTANVQETPNLNISLDFGKVLNKAEVIDIDLKADEEAETLFAQMLKEERIFLESELKTIIHQGRSIKLNLGSDDDKTNIASTMKSLQDFFKEVVDICTTQDAEVHVLKQNVLQSWAWYEEVKSRYAASKDESVLILLKAQPLDSVSEKQLADIRHTDYYLESQIVQAHHALDDQWENFQDYCKKTHRIQIPTMEMIFQTLVKQNAILGKQNYILKDIASRIKNKARSALGPSLLISVSDIKGLPDELKRLRMNHEDVCQIQHEHVVNRRKAFTKKKADILRSFLKKREYYHVSAARPQLSTSIIQASPSTKLKQRLLTSPLVKQTLPNELGRAQSTPKSTVVKFDTVSSQSTNPMQALQNFAVKFETKNFNTSDKNFTPLSKSVISGSPNSAFVSASFGSTPTSSVLPFKPVILSVASTSASFIKTPPSYVTVSSAILADQPVITISATSVSKLTFNTTTSTTAPVPLLLNTQEKAATIPFSSNVSMTNVTKSPSFTFHSSDPKTPTTVSPLLNLGKPDHKNVVPTKTTHSFFDTSNTKSTSGNFSTPSVKPTFTATSSAAKPIVTSVPIFNSTIIATTSPAPFLASGATSTSSIFANPTQNLNEIVVVTVAESKPFMFSSVVTTATVTTSTMSSHVRPTNSGNILVTPLSTIAVATTSPTISTKSTTALQPSFFTATPTNVSSEAIIPPKSSTNIAFSSSVFPSTQATIKSPTVGSFPVPSSEGSVLGIPVTSAPSQSPIFSSAGTKPGIFSSVPVQFSNNVVTSTSSVPSTSTILQTNITITSTNGASSSSSGVLVTQPANPQQSIFDSGFASTLLQCTVSPANSTAGLIFGNAATTKSSIFGSSDGNTTKPSIFGGSNANPTNSSIFGNVASPVSSPTAFGGVVTSTPESSIFGSASVSQPSVFGAGPSSSPNTSIFRSGPATTTQSQGFGMFGDTTQKTLVFANAVSANSAPTSVFGSSSPTNAFGNTTTENSGFGQGQSSFDNKSGQSVFGQTAGFGSPSTTNAFGGSTSFGQSTSSIFGNTPATSTGSIFGGTSATSSGFGSTSVFGTPVSSTTPSVFRSGSVFSSNTGSFGFGTLSVGSVPPTSNSGFASSNTSNPFGGDDKNNFGGSATASGSIFGSNSTSVFGTSSQNFGSGFGSQSQFGQQSTFGQTTFGNSNFGQASPGPFSGGSSGSVAQSGFGAGPSFQKSGVFGGSAVFGSTSSFGSAPSFGSASAFGNSSFGSPPKIFGAGGTSFGVSPSNQSSGFGNLANQPTVGFGNLAQQASNPSSSNAPFSGSSSFSSWR